MEQWYRLEAKAEKLAQKDAEIYPAEWRLIEEDARAARDPRHREPWLEF